MRILHCIFTLGGGGAERQLTYLARELAEAGLDVHVAFVRSGPNLRSLEQSDVVLHWLPIRAKYDPRILSDLHRLIARLKPDVVQTWLTQMDILAGVAAWWQRIPVVLAERSSVMAYPPNMRHLLRCIVGRKATSIVANSEMGTEYWRQRGFKGRLTVIANGVALEQIRDAEACSTIAAQPSVTLSAHDDLVLFAGRYGEEKNLDVLLRAFSLALACCENAIAVLFGDGPMLKRMRDVHATLPHRNRIHICGYTHRLWGYMRRARLFVSLSAYEGNPNVVLEAIAASCPLVLSDIPAHRAIVDEESALLVPAWSPEAAAHAIAKLLADPQYALRLAQRARSRVSHCSISEAARQYQELYATLSESVGRKSR